MGAEPTWRQAATKRLNVLAAASLVALWCGQMGRYHYFLELFAHFLPYYALILLVAACAGRGKTRMLWLVSATACAVWLLRPPPARAPVSANGWTLLWYNVHFENADPAAESVRILAERADIAAFAELDENRPAWLRVRQAYPYGCGHREAGPFALVLWSRQPLAACETFFVDAVPYVRAVREDGTAVYALHPPPPVNAYLAGVRRDYLRAAAEKITRETSVVVVGDLNSSPFSPVFRDFAAHARITAQTPAYLPTWQPFGLNIDHVLSREPAQSVRALAWRHSDHRPLVARFSAVK